jgi:hypothetical protein
MKRIFIYFLLLSLFNSFILSTLAAQTYVWKNGHALIEDPDSITFVKPDRGLQVYDSVDNTSHFDYMFTYPTVDHSGKPCVMSAMLSIPSAKKASKQIGKMAMYNHYTILRSDEAPSVGELFDLQTLGLSKGMAVVSADYEGFGATGDRVQAYCYAEANARASIDALLAAREWLTKQGYTFGDSILNYGYSQGGQTALAALKLSQTEYRGRVHFAKTIAGAGPYDLRITFRQFLEWKRIGMPAVLPMSMMTLNELYQLGIKDKEAFLEPLASNVKSWITSKKFSLSEFTQLLGTDSVAKFMQPAYCDSTSAEMKRVLSYVDKMRFTGDWTPDADTDVKLYHSLNDDIVAPDNSKMMYQWLVDKGVQNAVLDMSTLTGTHLGSATYFLLNVITYDLNDW